jgi:two-component system response regulator YesN
MQIEEQLRGAFREFRLSYVLRELDGFICVLGASDTSANKFRFSVIEAAKHIADQYQNCFPILIGLGSVVGQIGNLQTSLLQSRRAIYSHFFFPDQAVLEEVNADAVGTNLLSNKEANEEALLQLIGRNDMDGISRWIREFLETFPADPDYQYLVYTALFSLTARLQKFCYEMNISTESFEPELLTIIQHPDQLICINAVHSGRFRDGFHLRSRAAQAVHTNSHQDRCRCIEIDIEQFPDSCFFCDLCHNVTS